MLLEFVTVDGYLSWLTEVVIGVSRRRKSSQLAVEGDHRWWLLVMRAKCAEGRVL